MFSAIENNAQRNELEKFYKKYKNCFLNTAYSVVHNKSDTEDAVQEAFCKIARSPDKFFGVEPENRLAYMNVIVKNTALDILERNKKETLEEFSEESFYEGNLYSLEDEIVSGISTDRLKQFIKSLPPIQYDVLTLRCLMGFSVAETAERLNISETTVRQRLYRARKAIRKFIEKEESDDE
ncbi:MAG: RNA polymerase sigma factor [Firmicutes bacterium]|nr:RNA polymerase sigma factor [[Eubacterium] siraeum]MCM1487059.1 RNA polymerase sigma factor [Bacillota bacterium]